MPAKQTQQEFIDKSIKIFGDQLDYSKVNYVDSRSKIILTCKKHGNFYIKPGDHLSYKRGCSICSGVQYNTETFIDAARAMHGDKYFYDKVNYEQSRKHVVITCKLHGNFIQAPHKHLIGQGCPKCKKSAHKNANYFLEKSKEIHGDIYDYSKVVFSRMFDRVEIICKIHGSFWQFPSNHINHKMGCGKCATESTRLSLSDFINRSNIIHNNFYDYSKSVYINCATKLEIICPKHGSFWQTPGSHLICGADCSWCVGKNSQKEKQWLDYLDIPIQYRNKILFHRDKHYRVDAYDPINNVVYEFNGDYWHGNPEIYNSESINKHNKQKFSSLYEKTIKREKELISLGYNIVSIWENDFMKILKHQKLVS
jgi:hypothetical protein